ncbi:MAG: xanthine dehydrogenase family protein molybdopterin-binding subunit, partial [Chloroflexi bacterium]|nr:xanthine dehydrogenase family protein molybdopterin-binding subunit [Chloroflexota bacterium]
MPLQGMGAAMRRLEDPRLLRGQATFIEDLELPRQLHVAFARGEYPHARLRTIRVADALQVAGVVSVATAYDLGARRIPAVVPHPALRPCGQPILADGAVRYVGEP